MRRVVDLSHLIPHFGRFSIPENANGNDIYPRRLPKKKIEQIFEGLPGVKVITDDIIIHGHNAAEHDTQLRAVL